MQEKEKQLCKMGICCSMGEARRIVVQGAFDRVIKKFEKNRQKAGIVPVPAESLVLDESLTKSEL